MLSVEYVVHNLNLKETRTSGWLQVRIGRLTLFTIEQITADDEFGSFTPLHRSHGKIQTGQNVEFPQLKFTRTSSNILQEVIYPFSH
jgi:hypothetical protein